MILKCKRSVYQQFKKSLSDSRLEYFKRELKKILKKQLEDETSKIEKSFLVVDALCKSMLNPLYESEIMEKAHREHLVPKQIRALNKKTGKTYTTTVYVNPNKQYGLKKYHETDSKGAKIAIGKLIKAIDKCKSSQELLNLVLKNKERFSDKFGYPLPIVDELKKYVSEKNVKLEKYEITGNQKTDYESQKKIKRRNAEPYNKKRAEHIRNDVKLNEVNYTEKLLNRNEAQKKIKQNEGKSIQNKETGITANYNTKGAGKLISQKAINKSIKNGFSTEEHFTLASHIKELFENANLISVEPDRDSDLNDNVTEVRRYAIKFNLNGKNGFALMTIKLNKDDSKKIYALELDYLKKIKPATSDKVKDLSNHETLAISKPHRQTGSNTNIAQSADSVKENNKTVNKTVTLKLSDFPAEFSKGKWKKQTQILLDYMNNCKDANPTVMEVYKSLGKLKNNLPFSIHKTNKKLPNGAFCIKGRPVKIRTGWESLEPVEQMLYIDEIDNSNEDLLKKTCSSALHEIMHMIDFSTRPDKNYNVYRSNNIQFTGIINNAKVTEAEIKEVGKFVDELKEERNKHIGKMNEYAAQCKKLNEDFKRGVLSQNEANAKQNDVRKDLAKAYELFKAVDTKTRAIGRLTDIYDALTNGKMRDEKGYGGHGRMYYRTPGNKETEIMANIGSLAVDSPEIMDFLEKRQPDVVKAVYNMFDDILKELNNE